MATAVFNQAIGTLQSNRLFYSSGAHREFGNVPVRLTPKGFKAHIKLSINWTYGFSKKNFGVIQASASPTLVDPVSSPSNNNTADCKKKRSKQSSFSSRFIYS